MLLWIDKLKKSFVLSKVNIQNSFHYQIRIIGWNSIYNRKIDQLKHDPFTKNLNIVYI